MAQNTGSSVGDALRQTYENWGAQGHRIVFIIPAPELLFNPFSSFSKAGFMREKARPLASRTTHETLTQPYRDILAELKPKDRFEVLDPADVFCFDGVCIFQTDEGILGSDFDPLSGKGARLITDALFASLLFEPIQ